MSPYPPGDAEYVPVIIDRSDPRSPSAEPGTGVPPIGADSPWHLALRWVVRLRYGFIAGEIAIIAALHFGLHIPLPMLLIATVIGFQTASNWILTRRKSQIGVNPEHIVGLLFAGDTICLTTILAFSGGPSNPFSLLYLVQITFSAIVLRKLWTWALGVLSTVSFGLLFWVSIDVPAFREHSALSGQFSLHLLGMWIAFATAALLIAFFVGKLSAEARKKEHEILMMQKRLARNDRLASLVTLAAGAAHEMATPLATIAVTAKEMEHDAAARMGDTVIEEDARLIRSQVERCRLILERMGAQGADPFGETPKSIRLRDLLLQIRDRFPKDEERIYVALGPEDAESCVVPVRAAIEALAALVKNALDASPHNKPVMLQARSLGNGGVRFEVHDDGCGMTPEILERVAEPFFTTKAPGQGMGLGAFLAHLFAQTLGGSLWFDSEPGQGCNASLELPDMRNVR
jgi:two-component system sensor histidine kinase RegB